MQLADTRLEQGAREVISQRLLTDPGGQSEVIHAAAARTLGLTGLCDILIFFGVLMVGFAYVWKRGDLDWIRAVGNPETGGGSESGETA